MSYHSSMALPLRRSALEWMLLLSLSFEILWKGGKALDAVWALALMAVAVTLVDVFLLAPRDKVRPSLFPWTMALLFLGWTVMSFVFSLTRNYGLDEVMMTVSLVLLFHFVLTIPADALPRFQSRLARVVAVATLVACGIGIAVYALQPVSRFVGTFFDYRFHTDYWPNAWAEFLLLAWPMLVWSLWGRPSPLPSSPPSSPPSPLAPLPKGEGKLASRFDEGSPFSHREKGLGMRVGVRVRFDVLKSLILGLVLGCLLLSFSRGAIIAFGAQLGLLSLIALFTWGRTVPFKRLLIICVLTFCTALLTFACVNRLRARTFPVQSVIAKATLSSDEGTSSVSERAQFWKQAIRLAGQKPLFGWGPYSFRFVQPHLQEGVLATSDHPHHVFLKLAMERGVTSALVFALLLLWCLGSGAVTLVRQRDIKKTLMTALLLTSVIGVLLHNLIDYNLQFVAIALPFWLMLGTLVSRDAATGNWDAPYGCRHTFGKLREIFIVLLACVLLVLTGIEGWYLFASSRARHFEASGDVPKALHWYRKTDASLFPRDAWLSRAAILMRAAKPFDSQSALSRALSLNAQDYRAWKLQGDVSLALKHIDVGRSAFEKAYEFGRYNDLGITRVLVELYRRDRATLNARRHEFGLLLNEFGLAIERNTHFIDLSANVEELQRLCSLLAAIHPSAVQTYSALSERSAAHAAAERAKLRARPRGLLW